MVIYFVSNLVVEYVPYQQEEHIDITRKLLFLEILKISPLVFSEMINVPNCGPCPYGHWRKIMLDHVLVWSKHSSKHPVHLQMVH